MHIAPQTVRVLPILLLLAWTAGPLGSQSPDMPELEELIESLEALQGEMESPDEMLKLIQQRMGPYYPDSRPLDGIEFFETMIRPLLAENCYTCHGPEKQKENLRLDRRSHVFEPRDSGTVVIPGDADASLLSRVISYNEEIKMPPNKRLDPSQTILLNEWIEMGAPWPDDPADGAEEISMEDRLTLAREGHWSFQPVRSPGPPEIGIEGWNDRPIDAFVAARLSQEGLTPSSPADSASLLKRVYYDLTGLPPTYEEIRGFTENPSEEAYQTAVDSLLASPHFGERWGRHWLDVARYADTKGYVFNQERTFAYSHTYRDYVIRAFNKDLPYNRFLVEQIAADHLDLGEDKHPLAALGFLTLGRRFVGNIHDITDDRIDVVTRGTLGLTVTCARCHDHKFDPIPTEDYYSLYGVFRSTEEPDDLPLIEEPDNESPLYQEYLKELNSKKADLEDYRDKIHLKVLSDAREKIAEYLLAVAEVWSVTEGVDYRKLRSEDDLEPNLIREWHEFLKRKSEGFEPIFYPWSKIGALSVADASVKSATLTKRFAANSDSEKKIHPLLSEAFNEAATPDLSEVARIYGRLFARADKEWKNLLSSHAQITLQSATGPIVIPTGLTDPDLESFRQILYTDKGPLDIKRDRIDKLVDRDTRNQFTNRKNAIAKVEATHPGRPNRAQLLIDSDKLFDPYVFKRGKPGSRGADIPRRFLAVLSPDRKPFEEGSGRLELARAIVSPTNPLTARVYVNRVWSHLFGSPLVGTTSDFGVRSDLPTHPDLLDHLAHIFMENGWSTKNLIRAIVLSRTYRQSSLSRSEAAAIDPENRLLWRQNRRRLDFESIRDSLLLASGELDRKMGGFSVDITREPYTTRRTVYSLIERQNLPALFRTFDFASPDMHSPKRYETLIPQQALFLLNSPFIADMAQSLVDRPEVTGEVDLEKKVEEIYRIALGREPDEGEKEKGISFLGHQEEIPPPVLETETTWEYGYGKFPENATRVNEFIPFPHFGGETWKVGPKVPDPKLGWVTLNRLGGHPDVEHAVIRRWISPVSATLSIEGHLQHKSDNGDGVWGYLVSSREGVIWSGHAHSSRIPTDVTSTVVAPGDTLDLVVSAGPTQSFDSFVWHPRIWVSEGYAEGALEQEWLSRLDFSGPPEDPPPPLSPLEQFAQVLLLTNEFMFVD